MATKPVKKKKKLKLTVFEVETCCSVLNAPVENATIKDVRGIASAYQALRVTLPEAEEQPKPPKPEPGKTVTDKAKEEFRAELTAWAEKMKERNDIEIDVELTEEEYKLIAHRISNFRGFRSDQHIRDKVLVMAQKFGV